jgi:hypothetical protein
MKWQPDDETVELWGQAATHAGVDPESVHLFVAEPRIEGYGAMHYAPGMWAVPGDNSFDFSDGLRERIHELKDEHVIVVAPGPPPDMRLLLLRHEAEHVAQDQYRLAIGQVGLRLFGVVGDAYYGTVPIERDADAAATALRKELGLPASEDDLRGSFGNLLAATWDAPVRETLPVRLLAYSLFNPARFDTTCRSSSTFAWVNPDELLESLVPGAKTLRAAVGDRYVKRAEDAVAYDYNPAAWEELSQGERDTVLDYLRRRLVDEERRVVEEIEPLLEAE